jgi:CBS domain containing-hemolysin-like protein
VSLLVLAVIVLVAFGSVLALAAASLSRMSPVHVVGLRATRHRNTAVLERVAGEPTRHLDAVQLVALFVQNGSAILVAVMAERYLGSWAIGVAAILFTLAYFVVVEALAKRFAILHTDRVALALAPVVWFIGRAFAWPTQGLIALTNGVLPAKGVEHDPFVVPDEVRTLAEVGRRHGIEQHQKEIIHSVFQFGNRTVREIMVPRPDIVAIDLSASIAATVTLIVRHGVTRLPAYRRDLDHTEGIVHAKDVLDALHRNRHAAPLSELLRPVPYVPESRRLGDLLREMQQERFHLAMVSDEYGSVAGLVTLEDLLEELVGQITDEYDREAPDVAPLGGDCYRVNAALPISELNETLRAALPHDRWNTVGGLMFGLSGAIPPEGAVVELDGFQFTVEKIQGRRILTVLVERLPQTQPPDG